MGRYAGFSCNSAGIFEQAEYEIESEHIFLRAKDVKQV